MLHCTESLKKGCILHYNCFPNLAKTCVKKERCRIPIKPPKAHITIFGSYTNGKILKNLRWSSLHKNEMIRDMFENKDLPRFSHIVNIIDGTLLFCDFWCSGCRVSCKQRKVSFTEKQVSAHSRSTSGWCPSKLFGVHRSHSWPSIGVWPGELVPGFEFHLIIAAEEVAARQ